MSTTRRVGLVIVCAVLVSASGCSEPYGKKLVGTWEGTEQPPGGGKAEVITFEFKADGTMRLAGGPIELTGTYKVVKEDGKTLTLDTEVTGLNIGGQTLGDEKAKPKGDKKTLTVVFEDDDTIVMTPADGKQEAKKLKRKK
jgi:hypothetical protein